jgi:class 3 adenylate cyclase
MQLRDGTFGQRALFAALVLVALIGVTLSLADKVQRLGTPNVGWLLDDMYLSPARRDVSIAGLRGGGRALRINGEAVTGEVHGRSVVPLNLTIGATNTLEFRTPGGEVRTLTAEVQPWTVHDYIFTEGATNIIGLLFLIVGVASFALRPYEPASWALLALSSFSASALITTFLPIDHPHRVTAAYFLIVVAFLPSIVLHTALVFPVVTSVLADHPRALWLVYGVGVLQTALNLGTFFWDWGGPGLPRMVSSVTMLVSILVFIGRCAFLALRSVDPLVVQRARILLAGSALGLSPFAFLQFLRENFEALEIDARFAFWPLCIFVLALARVAVRQELVNARIAVRRAVLYTVAVAVLTVLALLLSAVSPYGLVVLLFPLLYFWPRFDARLQRRLYPQRARFPELLRTVGGEMATAPTVEAVLDVLAEAPGRLCNARSSAAVLFADGSSPETVRCSGPLRVGGQRPVADELIVQLMRTTRREVRRDQLGVEPQYTNIRGECAAGFARLAADVMLPMLHEQRVIGVLAVGRRESNDPYEAAEIDALSTAAQQAVQAVMRVAAMDRLRSREREFGDLKRFFPPQIIDQVMARGGAAELRSQRKVVSVVFADLRGFTAFSDSVEPEEVMATLAEYHAAVGRRIAEQGGTLERFAGDGFMVFFNDPVDQPDHAERAVALALAMRGDVERLRRDWQRKGYQIHIGIGIHTGYATCGFVGYEGRRDYAVIGNVSNLAARLSDAAAPGEILISARVLAEIADGHAIEPAGELQLKGFHQAHQAYRVVGEQPARAASR